MPPSNHVAKRPGSHIPATVMTILPKPPDWVGLVAAHLSGPENGASSGFLWRQFSPDATPESPPLVDATTEYPASPHKIVTNMETILCKFSYLFHFEIP